MTDYDFYKDNYLLGKEAVIDTAIFPFYERKASQEVRKYTLGNIDENKTIIDDVQLCVCELAEYIYKQDNSNHDPSVASEKVGEFSISYVAGQTAEDIRKSIIKGIIYTWLANTGLLYRGC